MKPLAHLVAHSQVTGRPTDSVPEFQGNNSLHYHSTRFGSFTSLVAHADHDNGNDSYFCSTLPTLISTRHCGLARLQLGAVATHPLLTVQQPDSHALQELPTVFHHVTASSKLTLRLGSSVPSTSTSNPRASTLLPHHHLSRPTQHTHTREFSILTD